MIRSSAVVAGAVFASLLFVAPAHSQTEGPAATEPEAQPAPAESAPAEAPASESSSSGPAAPETSTTETATQPETVPTIPVTEEAAQAAAPASDSTQLDELVVTATKRRQTVREIPSTVNVVTGEKLEIQGARELSDYIDQIPGIQIQELAVSSARKIVIRGITATDVGNQTVGTLLGDVPVNDPIGSYTVVDPDTWDLETFEVLKGPQGTLFGASSLSGVIRYVPQAPQLGIWQARLAGEYMSVRQGGAAPTYSAAVNVPVGNALALRFAGVSETRPGVIDINTPNRQVKDADEAKKWAGRAMALWQPTERLTLNAWYMAQERKSDEQFFTTNFEGRYERNDAPSASPTKRAYGMGVLDARYKFDAFEVVSLTSLQDKENRWDIDASYILEAQSAEEGSEVGRTKRDVEAKGFMQELRFVSPDDGDWLWQFGAFYSKFDATVITDIFFTDPATSALFLAAFPPGAITTENGVSLGRAELDPLGATESALFGETTYKLGSLDITLGGRYYKTHTAGTSTVSGIAPFAATGEPSTVENLEVADKGFSPKVALAWQVTGDILAYGSVSRGFQYGGVNNRAVPSPNSTSPRTYTSSALWAYEAGLRTDWFERSVRADVTGFLQDWKDAQIEQLTPPADFYIDNVGKVKVKGVEASLRFATPIDGLTLDGMGAYVDARTASPFTAGSGEEVPAGAEMPNAPKVQYSTSINYALDFGQNWTTAASLQFNHVDKSFGNIEHTGLLDARNMLNFNVTLTGAGLAWKPSIGVVINNITDQHKITATDENPETENDPSRAAENFSVGYTRPRTIIVRVGASFQ